MESNNSNMGRFFDWLAKPMEQEDITAWYLANNITPELTELFRDFCFSFLQLLRDTYLGDDFNENKETRVGMTKSQKKNILIGVGIRQSVIFKKKTLTLNSMKTTQIFLNLFSLKFFMISLTKQ